MPRLNIEPVILLNLMLFAKPLANTNHIGRDQTSKPATINPLRCRFQLSPHIVSAVSLIGHDISLASPMSQLLSSLASIRLRPQLVSSVSSYSLDQAAISLWPRPCGALVDLDLSFKPRHESTALQSTPIVVSSGSRSASGHGPHPKQSSSSLVLGSTIPFKPGPWLRGCRRHTRSQRYV